MRRDPRLVRDSVGIRAPLLRASTRRRGTRHERVHARLLPARPESLHRGHGDEAVARDPQEPQAARGPAAVSGRQGEALLPARHRASRAAVQAADRLVTQAERLRAEGHPIGDIYLDRDEIARRVAELGRALLVAPLKSSAVFLADLSRALEVDHELDVIELAPYGSGRQGGGVRLLKDLDRPVAGRDVVLVEDVVDTGLTLGFLMRCFAERGPASLAAVTLLDRPYRRLVDDIPLHHVGFTVPDELFAGYGLGLDERWRALPDLHLVVADELPAAIDAA